MKTTLLRLHFGKNRNYLNKSINRLKKIEINGKFKKISEKKNEK